MAALKFTLTQPLRPLAVLLAGPMGLGLLTTVPVVLAAPDLRGPRDILFAFGPGFIVGLTIFTPIAGTLAFRALLRRWLALHGFAVHWYASILMAFALGFRMILAAVVCTTIVSTASAQLRASERTLNLKGLQPAFAHAKGKRLLLGVITNQVPELLILLSPAPTPVKKRDRPGRLCMVQVVFGKDLLGFAEVSLASGPATRKASKIKTVDFILTFDTEVQAAKAAQALRPTEPVPTPIERPKSNK